MGDEGFKNNLSKLSVYTKLIAESSAYLGAGAYIKTYVCLHLLLSEHVIPDLTAADDMKLFWENSE